MATEDISARFLDLDAWATADAVEAMFEGQLSAVAAVRPALPAISAAADAAATALGASGRLIYLGAGTSGRIGVQDGAELTPTFDWPTARMVFAMAGGMDALVTSIEGAEDDEADAIARIDALKLGPHDVVIGIAASGTTPFTVAGIKRARARRAVTVGIANNPATPLLKAARHSILVETGVEVIVGSTRMKAGTAQKVVLNLLSTAIMVRLGRVHRGLMVQMQQNNSKLRRRAEIMVGTIAGATTAAARRALKAADGDIKVAALIVAGAANAAAARKLLARHKGSLRAALATFEQ